MELCPGPGLNAGECNRAVFFLWTIKKFDDITAFIDKELRVWVVSA
jgi:hypothetical protein